MNKKLRAIRKSSRSTRSGSASCRDFACRSAASRVPARPFPPGLILGLPKQKLEEFSFALAVVLTPPVIAQEAHRLIKAHALSGQGSVLHLFVPGLVGMVLSFIAGLLALKLLSRWLEGGRWKFFGFYCLAAAAGVLLIHFKVK